MKKQFKYTVIFLSAFALRLIPFRAPNIEPLMASIMPISKKFTKFTTFFFGFASIFVYDLVTSGVGVWTVFTAIAYGMLGVGASYYFKNRSGWKSYASYAIVGTIVYDLVTGLTIGPIFFNQSLLVSFIGQIPFTLMHLLGNVSFAILVSPVLEKWIIKSEETVLVKDTVLVI